MIRHLPRGLLLALTFACGPALALTCGASAGTHAFGTYYPMSGNAVDTSSSIAVNCSGLVGLLVSVEIHLGTGSGGYGARKMLSGANALSYNLYTDAGRSTVWGDGTGGSAVVSYSLLLPLLGNSSRTDWVYGRIPARQVDVRPGNYSDSIVVTVDYFAL